MTDNKINPELKNIIEAALLVAGQPLTLDRLSAMFAADSQPTKEELRDVLATIEADYAERGIELQQIGKGWRIQTRPKYAEFVAKLLEERPPRYSRALLETLAIVAYRQPVTRGEIEDIRGVAVSTEIVRTLTERGWIKQVGVREVPGRPAIYGTTPAFLEHFSLKSLEDMPPLAELRSIEDISADLDRRVKDADGTGATRNHSVDEAAETPVQPSADDAAAEEALAETDVEATALAAGVADAAIAEPEHAQANVMASGAQSPERE